MTDPSDLTAETVDRVAAGFGLSPSDEERRDSLETARSILAMADAFDVEPPASTEPADVREGDDPYNAFRLRFDLASDDPAGDAPPLEGLSVAVKENIAVAGVESTCGSNGFSYRPRSHATVVARLLSAGADVVGTTNMDEFAYFTTGETCGHGRIENPVAEGRVPGGSSSGSAAAVGGGLVDAALGTDTAGSIRIPASFCGVVGLKPTHRTVSRFGVVDLSPSLDHVGPLARDVETVARITEVIAGSDPLDPSTRAVPSPDDLVDAADDGVGGLSLGVVEEAMATASDDVADAIEESIDLLEAAGATVERLSLEGFDLAPAANGTIVGAEFASVLAGNAVETGTGTTPALADAFAALKESDGEAVGEHVREQAVANRVAAEARAGKHYLAALDFRRRFTERVRRQFRPGSEDGRGLDVLVTPTTPIPAPEFGAVTGMDGLLRTLANTAPFNLAGTPAVSVPCGETGDGLPVGLQVVADWHEEATALRVARAVEISR
ncbi:amidase [Natrialbaceae archaeon GCM10025810]|uniref:amidase n=1 Tax=Halovalidus salilacus TaxID=3075124 RepID=UPI00361BEDB0